MGYGITIMQFLYLVFVLLLRISAEEFGGPHIIHGPKAINANYSEDYRNNIIEEINQTKGISTPKDRKPNIVLLLADDLGYGDLGWSGHPTSHTPQLDSLAATSRYLTHFYVSSPICSPSRASLLTGRYQFRSGVYPGVFMPNNVLGLPTNETTIAALLKAQGYRTLAVGKWHLGVGAKREFLPTQHGFDEYFGIPYSHDMCPCRTCFPNDSPCYDLCWKWDVSCPLFSNSTIVEQPVDLTTLTERYVEHTINFIKTMHRQNQPFFVYLPFNHVHHPQFASSIHQGLSPRGRFGDSLLELDWAVGRIMSTLRDLGAEGNTLVWFTSDNGPSMTRHERGGCAGPLRCGKGTTWDGGIRVPSIVHWSGKIKPGRSDALVSSMDVLPTIAALVGANISDLTLDGVDVSPVLLNPSSKSPRKFLAVYPEGPEQDQGPFAVIHHGFKAHFYTKGSDLSDAVNYDPMCPARHPLTKHDPPLLYNLYEDPGERYDLSNMTTYRDELNIMTSWRQIHMKSVTWMPPRTRLIDPRVQPCCNDSSCEPFPQCCDCNYSIHMDATSNPFDRPSSPTLL